MALFVVCVCLSHAHVVFVSIVVPCISVKALKSFVGGKCSRFFVVELWKLSVEVCQWMLVSVLVYVNVFGPSCVVVWFVWFVLLVQQG